MPAGPAYQLRDLRRRAARAHAARVALARQDPSVFAGLVMRDEQTNKPIKQAMVHEAWQELATKHDRLLIWSHPIAGKTMQLSVCRVLWELGRNPSLRVAVISRTDLLAVKIVRLIGNMILKSPELHEVFPKLRKSGNPGDPWNDHMLVVERGNPNIKDPSVQAFGEASRSIIGTHVDLLIVDDILDEKNTMSVTQMDDMWTWFNSLIEGRLEEHARVIVVGNAWHPRDFLHRLAEQPRWKAFKYPVMEPTGEVLPDGSPKMMARWPERWPMNRIMERKATLDAARPGEFMRMMMCEARDDTQSRFKVASIEKCKVLGEGRQLLVGLMPDGRPAHLRGIPFGYSIFTGVDLAFQKHSASDLTCFFTIAIAPDGTRHVLCVESGRWYGPEVRDRAIDTYRRFQSMVIVENNGAQDMLLKFVGEKTTIPIKPFTTGRNKANQEFGVAQMSVEMDNGKWAIPNQSGRCHPEIDAWIKEMLYYDPLKHTGDRLMASWLAKEGARLSGFGGEGPRIESTTLDTMSR